MRTRAPDARPRSRIALVFSGGLALAERLQRRGVMKPTIAQLFDLHDRTAIVTGAAHGIGAGIAERLAEAGAFVVVTDVEPRDAELTVARIRSSGGRAQFVRCDVSRVSNLSAPIDAALQATKRLDVLVNNAGVFPMGTRSSSTRRRGIACRRSTSRGRSSSLSSPRAR